MNQQQGSPWKSSFKTEEITEVRQGESARFLKCAEVREGMRVVPSGFHVETEPAVLPEDMN